MERDQRMARAVELRRQGLSLQKIGTELDVNEGTIRRDLARWEASVDATDSSSPASSGEIEDE